MGTMQEYRALIEQVSRQTGLTEMKPDADGVVSLRVDDAYTLTLSFLESASKIHCFVEMMALPDETPSVVYREILSAGLFGKETAGGSFALDRDTNTLVYQYLFDFDAATIDPDRFTRTLEKIVSLVDLWVGHLSSLIEKASALDAASDETSESKETFLSV